MKNTARILSTITFVLLAALLVGGCTKSQRRNRALTTADRYFAAGQYDEAEAYYGKALGLVQPGSPAAIRQLGLIYAAEGRYLAAYPRLRYASTNEPANASTQLALAQVAAILNLHAQAKDSANATIKLDPGNEQALVLLCELVANESDATQLRQSVEQWQKSDKDRPSYHLALGILRGKMKDMDGAGVELNQAAAMDPKSAYAQYYLANWYTVRNDRPKSDAAFKAMADLAPVHSPLQVQYAKMLAATGRTREARDFLLDLNQKAPDFISPLLTLMELAYGQRQFDECQQAVQKVLARDPYNYEAWMERGRVSLAEGQGAQAVKDFEQMNQIEAREPRPQVQYELGLAYLMVGNRAKAAAALSRALALEPNYQPAKLLLADVQIRSGNADSAIQSLLALEKEKLPDAILMQVRLLLAKAYLALNNPAKAIDEFDQLETANPKDNQIPYLKGKAWLVAGDLNQALASFEQSLALAPDYPPALQDVTEIDLRLGRAGRAEALVLKQMPNYTNQALPYLLLGRIQLAESNNAEAEKSFQKSIELDPKLPSPYHMLARLYISEHQEKQALDKLNSLVAMTNDIPSLFQIAVIHEQLQEFPQARDSFIKILAVNSNDTPALNNLAYLDSEHLNQPDEAYRLAERNWELVANNPAQTPFAADTLGWILYKKGEYPRALSLISESAEKQTSDPEVQYHLGMAHYMMGEEAPARLALRESLSRGDFNGKADASNALAILDLDPAAATDPQRSSLETELASRQGDPIALMKLAAIEEHDGKPDAAADKYNKALQLNPDDLTAIIRLARLYDGPLHQPQKALEMARNAHQISDSDPNVSAFLGRMDFENRQFDEALSLLGDASHRLPNQPEVFHDLAWCQFSLGNLTQARAAMVHALDLSPGFPKADEAKTFVDMIDVSGDPSRADVPTRLEHAFQTQSSNYAPALFVQARLDEQQGKTNDAEQACEKIVAQFPSFAPARRQLGLLYTSDGNFAKAWPNLDLARFAYPDDNFVLRASGINAFDRKDYSRSSQWLTQCLHAFPQDPYLAYYLGMDSVQLHDNAKAKTYLQIAAASNLPANYLDETKRVLAQIK